MSRLPVEFDPPVRETPEDRFEIGLVLAGAISAGAYTAGVLDFFVEAFDAWQAAKDHDRGRGKPTVPQHRVLLHVVTGASGGAMAGALLLSALGRRFPPVCQDTPAAERARNPLYDAWVDRIDIKELVTTRDLERDPDRLLSLLDSTALRDIGQTLLRPAAGERTARPWLADPLRFFVTTTNLRGVPYRLRLSGAAGAGHDMVQHADHVRFALQTGSGSASAEVRPDEIALPPTPAEEPGQWALLLEAGLASGAFPLVLAPVPLARPGSDYNARVFVPGKGADVPPRFVPPAWRDPREEDDYRFLAVDGGVTRNEPLGLAHAVLAGALGQNPPRESETRRALILVAPLSETPELGPADDRGVTLASLSAALVRALLMTTRFDAQDLALAQDETIYGRFLIAPVRRGSVCAGRERPLASTLLAGFGGFLHRALREHDFFLGRRNAQQFLRRHFGLPEGHPLFKGWPEDDRRRRRYQDSKGVWHLPVIPLVPSVEAEQEPAPWPKGAVRPDDVVARVLPRLRAAYLAAVRTLLPRAPLQIGATLAAPVVLWRLRSALRARLERELRDADL